MKLVGAGGQSAPHFYYDASSTIASATAPQLILPRRNSCSHLMVQNISTAAMYLEFGSARAVATITNGQVSAVTVTNPGFGFSLAPTIQFRGGGANGFPGFIGSSEPLSPPPGDPAQAHCVMTGAAPNMSVQSIVIDNPGAGYLFPPYVQILNDPKDPNGCADPSQSAGVGILLGAAGGSYYLNGTACPTDALALFCATIGAAFTCKWMD
jgi:hypothetical protein